MEKFGKYLLLEKLDAGGMAEIYIARSRGAEGIGRFVAIKKILASNNNNRQFIDMFREEAKVVMNLSHANIVSIYEYGIENNQNYLVMEFVNGLNLRQLRNLMVDQKKELTYGQIVYIAKEAAAGLDYAHRAVDPLTGAPLNICHRDVSPQNIMISFEGEVKIIDFGIAKAETQIEQTESGGLKGKFAYMSPEQASGQSVDSRTDVFSLGIVLWELATGRKLFTGNNELQILSKIKDEAIPDPREKKPDVPLELAQIILRALKKEPAARYQSMGALVNDLSLFLNIHDPQFTRNDFSKFLQNTFQKNFLENRQKFSEYMHLTQTSFKTKPKQKIRKPSRSHKSAGIFSTFLGLFKWIPLLAILVSGLWWAQKKKPQLAAMIGHFKESSLPVGTKTSISPSCQLAEKVSGTEESEAAFKECQEQLFVACKKEFNEGLRIDDLKSLFSQWTQQKAFRQDPPNWASESRAYVLTKTLFDLGINAKMIQVKGPAMLAPGSKKRTYYSFESHTAAYIEVRTESQTEAYVLDPQFFDTPLELQEYLRRLSGSSRCHSVGASDETPWYACTYFVYHPVLEPNGPLRSLASLNSEGTKPSPKFENCGWVWLDTHRLRAETPPTIDAAVELAPGFILQTFRRDKIESLVRSQPDAPADLSEEYF